MSDLLSTNPLELDALYRKTIEDQRAYLLKLQDDFNKQCDEIKIRYQAEFDKVPAEDREGRNTVLKKEKAELEQILSDLKRNIHESTRKIMHTLEEIQRQKENLLLSEIEQKISSV